MANSPEVQSKFTADVTSWLSGMKQAQDSTETATAGVTGNIGKMIEAFEAVGPAALLVGGVGLAFEGLKMAVEYVVESVQETKELAESFRTLEYATGATNAQMNQYTAAMEMAGGSTSDLTTLMQGMVRAVKTHSGVLIANGMAASKSALDHMTFGEYLTKVNEIARTMETPLMRDEFLVAALGKSASGSGEKLEEMQKAMIKVAGTEILSPEVMRTMKELTEADGRLKAAHQARAAQVAAMAAPTKIAYENMRSAAIEWNIAENNAMDLVSRGHIQMIRHFDEVTSKWVIDYDKLIAKAKEYNAEVARNEDLGKQDAEREQMKAQPGSWTRGKGQTEGGGKKFNDGKPEKPEAPVDPMIAWENELAKKKALLAQSDGDLAQMSVSAEREFWAGKLALTKVGSIEWVNIRNRMAQDGLAIAKAATDAELKEDKARAAEQKKQDEEVAAWQREFIKNRNELSKLAVADQINASKSALEAQKMALEQEVALSQMTVNQEIAQRKALAQSEAQIDIQALQAEQANYAAGTAGYERCQNQILAIKRKTSLEIQALDNQQALNYKMHLDNMTQGWDQGIQKMLAGQMRLTDGVHAALGQMASYGETTAIKGGLDWAKGEASKTMATYTGTAQRLAAEGAAAVQSVALWAWAGLKNIAIQAWQAAAGAYNAIVSIPYVGPVLAPMAAATALGAVMVLGSHIASAEGGWERVPSDQVTQLHKNEMVLPSHIAEPVRQMAANGGNNGSQGDMHVHIHAVDARSLTSLLARNPEALLGPIRTAAANRRLA